MWLIWLVKQLKLRCPVTSRINDIQVEKVGRTWPLHSHYRILGHDPVSAMDTICGLVLGSTDWSTFLPSCVLTVTKPSGIFFVPKHSILSSCSVLPSSATKIWEIPLLALSLEIVCCGVWWRPLTHIRLTNVGYCIMCWEKNTRNQAKRWQVLMLSLRRVQVHLRDCLITQGAVLLVNFCFLKK